MPWWPFWDGEWYEALLWFVVALGFGWIVGIRVGMWAAERWDLEGHRKKWTPLNAVPWWKRIWRWLKGG